MRLRRTLLLFTILLSSLSIYASDWYAGIEGGGNLTMINTSSQFAETTHQGNFLGFDVAVPVEYRPLSWLSFDSGVRYIMKSNTYLKSDGLVATDDLVRMNHFLEFPLTVRLSYGIGDVRFFIGGGGYLGVRLFKVDSGMSYNANGIPVYNTAVVEMTDSDRRFDAGLIAEGGISYEYPLGSLYLSARYQYALTSLTVQKNGIHPYLNSLSVNLGFLFRIGGAK